MGTLHRISGCENDSRAADVLFLHGLGGHPFKTWRDGSDDSKSWPHWLGKEFAEVGVWTLGYASSSSARLRWLRRLLKCNKAKSRDIGQSMPLPDRANQVLNLMAQRGLGARPLLMI